MTMLNMVSVKCIDEIIDELGINKKIAKAENLSANFNSKVAIYEPKPNQLDVFNNYRTSRYLLISSPGGSGKSTMIQFCAADRLLNDPKAKLIISIPQSMISKSFGRITLQFPDGTKVPWDFGLDLTGKVKDSKIQSLIEFFNKTEFAKGIPDRICITTHSCLVLAYEQVKDDSTIFQNTTFAIDEAHHVCYSENLDEEDKVANKLGNMMYNCFKSKEIGSSIWLISATLFRGDSASILPSEIMTDFNKYVLPFDVYWRDHLKYLKNFVFNFVTYESKDDLINEIKNILKLGRRKSIVFCPYFGNLISKKDKYEWKNEITATIESEWEESKIMDLVEETNRSSRKAKLYDNEIAEKYDVILAAKMFDEGADWLVGQQIIDLTPSGSLVIQQQRILRLCRDIPGKDTIYCYNFYPKCTKLKNEDEFRTHFSKVFTALMASMLLQDTIEPIPYPYTKLKEKEPISDKEDDSEKITCGPDGYKIISTNHGDGWGEEGNNPVVTPIIDRNPFETAFPNPTEQIKVLEDIVKDLGFLTALKPNHTKSEVKESMISTLTKYGVEDNHIAIITHIAKLLRKQSNTLTQKPEWNTIKTDWMLEAGFDEIWDNSILDAILVFTSGMCGVDTFQKFREVYGSYKTPQEHVILAKMLAEENNGKLYSYTRLMQDKNFGLIGCMESYPELFKDILQENLREYELTSEEWVLIAEEMTKNNDGVLPKLKDLPKGLQHALYNSSKLFIHIPRSYTRENEHTPEEWVPFGEDLAKKNGGRLPSRKSWPRGLSYAYSVKPELFKHIMRKKLNIIIRSKEEKIFSFNEIIKQNNGRIPPISKIPEIDRFTIYDYPEEFKDIPRDNLRKNDKSPEEWAILIKEKAQTNGGILEKGSDLPTGMRNTIKNRPNLLKGVKQYIGNRFNKNKVRIIGEDNVYPIA